MIGFIVGLAIAWPFHHKAKPEPPTPVRVVSLAELKEIAAATVELKDIHDNYPWLRPWAEPTLDVISRLLDTPTDDDMEQLRHDMKVLQTMEDNDTI